MWVQTPPHPRPSNLNVRVSEGRGLIRRVWVHGGGVRFRVLGFRVHGLSSWAQQLEFTNLGLRRKLVTRVWVRRHRRPDGVPLAEASNRTVGRDLTAQTYNKAQSRTSIPLPD